jgi:hypothetical protein
MALSKVERDALPDSDFAVPSKRALPIHDFRHVRLAWSQLSRTEGLSGDERKEARARILERAKTLGMDTSDWDTIKAMRFELASLSAMSLDMPDVADHPNKMPFSGILTRLDQPSDAAPHGSSGKRVMLTKACAEKALGSLLGMAVDFTPDFDGHDPVRKIGIFTAATIEGDALHVEGFIYAADFPEEAARIKTDKDKLGFSFEAQQIHVESLDTDPLVIVDCVFTGAAILLKDKAAYMTTSLAASAAGDIEMTKEELEAILAAALKPVTDEIATIKASQVELGSKIEAGKELHAKVAPFADKLRSCAAGMSAAGIGVHQTRGHVAILNRMADNMEAEAMGGSLPHIYRDHDYAGGSYYAGADTRVDAPAGGAVVTETAAEKALKAEVASLTTKFNDLQASRADTATQPERKTIPPQIASLLAKAGSAPGDDGKVSVAKLDEALSAANVDTRQRIAIKRGLERDGLLAA